MIKMSRDESERYLYLREQMAIRDKESQFINAYMKIVGDEKSLCK